MYSLALQDHASLACCADGPNKFNQVTCIKFLSNHSNQNPNQQNAP